MGKKHRDKVHEKEELPRILEPELPAGPDLPPEIVAAIQDARQKAEKIFQENPDEARRQAQAAIAEGLQNMLGSGVTVGYLAGLEERIMVLEEDVRELRAKQEGKPYTRRKIVKVGDW